MINSKDKSKKDKSPIRLDTGSAIIKGLLVLILLVLGIPFLKWLFYDSDGLDFNVGEHI
jgi:hypothetical protein